MVPAPRWPQTLTLLVGRLATASVQGVPSWPARWSATEGWIGFAREELNLEPRLNFYAAGGHAYVASPGERPQPLSALAPFTPTHTTESWPPRG